MFPAASTASAVRHAPTLFSGEPTRAILIVDDAPDSLGAVRAGLAAQGYQTLVATSGEAALTLARRQRPDLILLDVVMPGMDGLETCRQLKGDAATSTIPVIFMSSRTEADDVVAGLERGAVDYVGKPLRMAEVCARVRTQLQLRRANEALEHAALEDALTGIANRRHFDSFMELEWQRAVRSGEPLSLVVLDVDHFKLYNDSLGHAAGDAALRQIGAVLQAQTPRPTDLAARYGGEEFTLLFAETPAASAAVLAENVRAGVEALGLMHPHAAGAGCITVSLGVATIVPSRQDDMTRFFNAADLAMYAAKKAGRNRVHAVDSGNSAWEAVRHLVTP